MIVSKHKLFTGWAALTCPVGTLLAPHELVGPSSIESSFDPFSKFSCSNSCMSCNSNSSFRAMGFFPSFVLVEATIVLFSVVWFGKTNRILYSIQKVGRKNNWVFLSLTSAGMNMAEHIWSGIAKGWIFWACIYCMLMLECVKPLHLNTWVGRERTYLFTSASLPSTCSLIFFLSQYVKLFLLMARGSLDLFLICFHILICELHLEA